MIPILSWLPWAPGVISRLMFMRSQPIGAPMRTTVDKEWIGRARNPTPGPPVAGRVRCGSTDLYAAARPSRVQVIKLSGRVRGGGRSLEQPLLFLLPVDRIAHRSTGSGESASRVGALPACSGRLTRSLRISANTAGGASRADR